MYFVRDADHRRTQFWVTVESFGDDTLVILDKHKPHFTISGERDVCYEVSVEDASADCTMNQICPPPGTPPFTAWYKFEYYDKLKKTMVTFEAAEHVPSENFQGFVGIGKLLRYVVVPSLTPIR